MLLNKKPITVVLLSLGLVYSTMLLGVFVASSHLGLSCPNWPLCPNGFSLPSEKYFFENLHRLAGIVTTIILGFTYFFTRKFSATLSKIMLLALFFVGIQIFIGMFVVFSKLHPLIVATHLSTGVVIFAIILIALRNTFAILKK